MKRKTTIFKTIVLAAAMMLGGAGSADAQTTLYYRTLTGTESDPADDVEQAWSTNDIYDSGVTATEGGWTPENTYTGVTTSIDGGLKFVGNNGSNKSVQFNYSKAISVSESTSILHLTADIDYSKARAGDSGTLYSYLKIGDVEIRYCGKNYTFYVVCNGTAATTYNTGYNSSDAFMNVDVTINQVTHVVNYTLKVYKNSSDENPLEITNTGTTGDALTYNLSTGISQGGASATTTHIIKNIKLTEESQSTHKITLSYQKSGSELKTVERDAIVGETYVVSDIDKVPFSVSTNKYYYVSDNASSLGAITADGDKPTVVVICRDAETWNWTLKGKCGDIDLGEMSSGTVTEGEEVSTYYKNKLLKGNTLYSRSSVSNSYKTQFTPTSDNYVQELTYEETVNKNVVFFSEAEDISGRTEGTQYLERNSGGKKAYFSSETNVTTLQPGTYQVCFVLHGYNGTKVTVKYGSETALEETQNSASATTYWSENYFTINTPTAITISGGSSTGCCDYIFITCSEAKVTNVDNLGHTFSSTLPLDFTDTNIRAYIAKYTSGNKVSLHRVYKVPANTGLLIFSDSELTNLSIPTTTAATEDVTDNVLVAQSTTGNIAQTTDTKTNYVLGMVSGTPTFLKVPEKVEVPAGKAYLSINYVAAAEHGSRLNIVFEDEATGIEAMHNAQCTMHNEMYDLQGRRVAQPSKGLYIVNGKKVVIK